MPRTTEALDLFPTDAPVPHAMIGRAPEVDRLSTLLGEGLNQIAVGPRRQGKTTICEAALTKLKRKGSYTIEIDLFAVPDLERLADSLVAGAIANRSAMRRAAHGAPKGSRVAAGALLSTAASAKLSAELGTGVQIAFSPTTIRREDPLGYLQHALRVLQRIAERDDKQLVLFIDEFQELAGGRHPFGDPDGVMQLMRAELQASPRVITLFAGSVAHMMRDLFGHERRAFYKWGADFEVGEIPEQTWRRGISERMRSVDLSFGPAALDRLIGHGELQARTTMLIAQQAYVAARSSRESVIDIDLVDEAFNFAMRSDALAHEITVRAVRQSSRHAFGILLRIAVGAAPYRGDSHATTAKRAIDQLRDEGLIAQRGAEYRGGWVVVDPLFRGYLVNLDR
jgi:AAA ATPase domain